MFGCLLDERVNYDKNIMKRRQADMLGQRSNNELTYQNARLIEFLTVEENVFLKCSFFIVT